MIQVFIVLTLTFMWRMQGKLDLKNSLLSSPHQGEKQLHLAS